MRHRKRKKLGKPTDQRQAMLSGLVRELLRHGKVTTTLVRAQAASGMAEKMITLALQGSLSSRRRILGFLPDKETVKTLYNSHLPRFEGRSGGYTRVTKCGFRRGDASPMALLEFV